MPTFGKFTKKYINIRHMVGLPFVNNVKPEAIVPRCSTI